MHLGTTTPYRFLKVDLRVCVIRLTRINEGEAEFVWWGWTWDYHSDVLRDLEWRQPDKKAQSLEYKQQGLPHAQMLPISVKIFSYEILVALRGFRVFQSVGVLNGWVQRFKRQEVCADGNKNEEEIGK